MNKYWKWSIVLFVPALILFLGTFWINVFHQLSAPLNTALAMTCLVFALPSLILFFVGFERD